MSQAFMDQAGLPRPVKLNPDGSVPVTEADGSAGDAVPALLARLAWELCELRRVYCEATDQAYLEYPGDGTEDAL